MNIQNDPLLTLQRVSKHFGGATALQDIDIEVFPGEVHALAGENGAGKSTLIKIMTGIYQADQGEIPVSYTHLTLPTIA